MTLVKPMREDGGAHYRVEIYEAQGFVLKYPRKERHRRNMENITAMQNYLAGKITGIISADFCGDHVRMPIPPGKRGDLYPRNVQKETIKPKAAALAEAVKPYRWKLRDMTSMKNVYYDDVTGTVYAIDYSSLQPKEGWDHWTPRAPDATPPQPVRADRAGSAVTEAV